MSSRTGVAFGSLLTLVVVATLGGCGSDSSSDGSSDANAAVTLVASTDVWGDVAKQVAGDLAGSRVSITSIITDPAADPHSYEASSQTLLALSKADVVVENGGGYDDFVDSMLKTARNPAATVLDAVDISDRAASPGGQLNEHVWYDFTTVSEVAEQIAAALAKNDPADTATFQANLAGFDAQLSTMEATEASIKAAHTGDGVAITEPVPLYLLEACGLDNKTPATFSEAIEEGTDVSATVLQQTEELFGDKQVSLLAYNEQTSGPETDAVLKAAKDNDVAVVPFTETLPSGKDYVSWMQDNLRAVQAALG